MQASVLLIPGIGNSGPTHWQSRWEALHSKTLRVRQADWDQPDCGQWAEQLERAVSQAQAPAVLVAHSLGCLVAAHWMALTSLPIKAALLVAVPDPSGPSFPREATGFVPLSSEMEHQVRKQRITMVSSSDDPFATAPYTQERAVAWKARHLALGNLGHINASSGLGDWPYGWQLVEELLGE